MRLKFLSICFIFLFGFSVSILIADETTKAPEMSAEQKAMMEAYMKAATPNEHHQHLAEMAGTWKTSNKMWMSPGAQPSESTGTCENKMILGDRYLHQECSGQDMGMGPFQGMGITGYDNVKKQYEATWVDNMGTAVTMATGKGDASGKVYTFTGTYPDPVTGKDKKFRWVSHMVDANNMTFEFYDHGPNGKEYKSMEMTYTK
jgi:hypothetical protein